MVLPLATRRLACHHFSSKITVDKTSNKENIFSKVEQKDMRYFYLII